MNAIAAPGRPSVPTVACVLKRGGIYDFNYVKILSLGVRRRLRRTFRFVCLTDAPPPHRDWLVAHRINLRPLIHDWPGAWAKIELFRPGLFTGRVIYFDLGTLLTRRLDWFADYAGPFAALSDFSRPGRLASAAMSWRAGVPGFIPGFIYEAFAADPARAMQDFGTPSAWIDHCCRRSGVVPDRLQTIAPGRCVTATPFIGGGALRVKPPGAGLVCFCGRPKPHALVDDYDLVREHWV